MHLDVYGTLSPPQAHISDELRIQILAEHEFSHAVCPQTGTCVDTAHTKYADDMVKTILVPAPDYRRYGHRAEQEALEGLVRKAEASSLLISQSLEEHGYAQNSDKLIGVIGLN